MKVGWGLAFMRGPDPALVLIVDEDARSATRLAKMLHDDGYAAEVAFDGASAISRLSRNPIPNALITDFHLPHADGLAVSNYARSRRATIAIFIVTGYPESVANRNDPLDPPATVITKPLDYADLVRRLALEV